MSFWSLITGTAVSFTRGGLSSWVPLCLSGLSSRVLLCLLPEVVSHHGYHCVLLVSHQRYCCVFHQRWSLISGTTVSFTRGGLSLWVPLSFTGGGLSSRVPLSFTRGGLSSRVPLSFSPGVVSHHGYYCVFLVSWVPLCLSPEAVSHHTYHCITVNQEINLSSATAGINFQSSCTLQPSFVSTFPTEITSSMLLPHGHTSFSSSSSSRT